MNIKNNKKLGVVKQLFRIMFLPKLQVMKELVCQNKSTLTIKC